MSQQLITPKFRVSFPSVITPRMNEMNGKDEFSLTALFPDGSDLTALRKAADEALVKKFGADKTKWPRKLKDPFRDQDERAKAGVLPDGHKAGNIFMTLKSTKRPGLVNRQRNPIANEEDFYAGCWAHAYVQPYAYDVAGSQGVAFALIHVQKLEDGEPLTGRPKVEDVFTAVSDEQEPAFLK